MADRRLEVVPPPPAFFAAAFATGLLIHVNAPVRLPDVPLLYWSGFILMSVAGVVAISAIVEMAGHGTTILPGKPASAFVSSGPYRFSRNPMYLSVSCFYAGLCLVFQLAWPLMFLPLAVLAVHTRVIRAEERYLAERFGPEYLAYKERVRRWI